MNVLVVFFGGTGVGFLTTGFGVIFTTALIVGFGVSVVFTTILAFVVGVSVDVGVDVGVRVGVAGCIVAVGNGVDVAYEPTEVFALLSFGVHETLNTSRKEIINKINSLVFLYFI